MESSSCGTEYPSHTHTHTHTLTFFLFPSFLFVHSNLISNLISSTPIHSNPFQTKSNSIDCNPLSTPIFNIQWNLYRLPTQLLRDDAVLLLLSSSVLRPPSSYTCTPIHKSCGTAQTEEEDEDGDDENGS